MRAPTDQWLNRRLAGSMLMCLLVPGMVEASQVQRIVTHLSKDWIADSIVIREGKCRITFHRDFLFPTGSSIPREYQIEVFLPVEGLRLQKAWTIPSISQLWTTIDFLPAFSDEALLTRQQAILQKQDSLRFWKDSLQVLKRHLVVVETGMEVLKANQQMADQARILEEDLDAWLLYHMTAMDSLLKRKAHLEKQMQEVETIIARLEGYLERYRPEDRLVPVVILRIPGYLRVARVRVVLLMELSEDLYQVRSDMELRWKSAGDTTMGLNVVWRVDFYQALGFDLQDVLFVYEPAPLSGFDVYPVSPLEEVQVREFREKRGPRKKGVQYLPELDVVLEEEVSVVAPVPMKAESEAMFMRGSPPELKIWRKGIRIFRRKGAYFPTHQWHRFVLADTFYAPAGKVRYVWVVGSTQVERVLSVPLTWLYPLLSLSADLYVEEQWIRRVLLHRRGNLLQESPDSLWISLGALPGVQVQWDWRHVRTRRCMIFGERKCITLESEMVFTQLRSDTLVLWVVFPVPAFARVQARMKETTIPLRTLREHSRAILWEIRLGPGTSQVPVFFRVKM